MAKKSPNEAQRPEKIEIDRSPSPEEEAGAFSTSDEKRLETDRSHQLALLRMQQGWVGKITGTADLPIKAAFFIVICLIIALFWCLISEVHGGLADKLITAIMTIVGFIIGERVGRSGND